MPPRLIVVDDHEVIRLGVANYITQFNIDVVGTAASGAALLELLKTTACDVILLDVRLPDMEGFDIALHVRKSYPNVAIVLFSAHENPSFKRQAGECGAAGYLYKGEPLEKYAAVIQKAVDSGMAFDRDDIRRNSSAMSAKRLGPEHNVGLTNRELDVYDLLYLGKSNKEIAEELKISAETVKEHVQNILRKVCVSDRTQAVVWAMKNNILPRKKPDQS
jgi:DNA-binding NarL/FixJ family response regulator